VDDVTQRQSVRFFDTQFRRQVQERDYLLNPFEHLALEHLKGEIFDLGSGLGNLSLEAGRRGHHVLAVDASPTAVERINRDARSEGLSVKAIQVDIENGVIDSIYDTIVAIGLLMFFRREKALDLLREIQEHVRPGGHAIVNVLIEGTNYLEMFDSNNYYLFGRSELQECFSSWAILCSRYDTFPAPGGTRKEFSTVIALKPSQRQ
jgi:tellurite methyltransferase